MSALPPKADIVRHGGNVRFVPEVDIVPFGMPIAATGLLGIIDIMRQARYLRTFIIDD